MIMSWAYYSGVIEDNVCQYLRINWNRSMVDGVVGEIGRNVRERVVVVSKELCGSAMIQGVSVIQYNSSNLEFQAKEWRALLYRHSSAVSSMQHARVSDWCTRLSSWTVSQIQRSIVSHLRSISQCWMGAKVHKRLVIGHPLNEMTVRLLQSIPMNAAHFGVKCEDRLSFFTNWKKK